jgi:hypothetical protein
MTLVSDVRETGISVLVSCVIGIPDKNEKGCKKENRNRKRETTM